MQEGRGVWSRLENSVSLSTSGQLPSLSLEVDTRSVAQKNDKMLSSMSWNVQVSSGVTRGVAHSRVIDTRLQ